MSTSSIIVGSIVIFIAALLLVFFTPISKFIESALEYVNPYQYTLPRRTFMAAIVIFLFAFGGVVMFIGFD